MLLCILLTRDCDRHSTKPLQNYNTNKNIEFRKNHDRIIAFHNWFSGTALCSLCIKTAVLHRCDCTTAKPVRPNGNNWLFTVFPLPLSHRPVFTVPGNLFNLFMDCDYGGDGKNRPFNPLVLSTNDDNSRVNPGPFILCSGFFWKFYNSFEYYTTYKYEK